MTLALNVAFWVWCSVLALFAVIFGFSARRLSAEAGGSGAFFFCVVAVMLLVISLALRGLAWWLL